MPLFHLPHRQCQELSAISKRTAAPSSRVMATPTPANLETILSSFALPKEVRLMIYHHLLTVDISRVLPSYRSATSSIESLIATVPQRIVSAHHYEQLWTNAPETFHETRHLVSSADMPPSRTSTTSQSRQKAKLELRICCLI